MHTNSRVSTSFDLSNNQISLDEYSVVFEVRKISSQYHIPSTEMGGSCHDREPIT
jgi:hypothetical protein